MRSRPSIARFVLPRRAFSGSGDRGNVDIVPAPRSVCIFVPAAGRDPSLASGDSAPLLMMPTLFLQRNKFPLPCGIERSMAGFTGVRHAINDGSALDKRPISRRAHIYIYLYALCLYINVSTRGHISGFVFSITGSSGLA